MASQSSKVPWRPGMPFLVNILEQRGSNCLERCHAVFGLYAAGEMAGEPLTGLRLNKAVSDEIIGQGRRGERKQSNVLGASGMPFLVYMLRARSRANR